MAKVEPKVRRPSLLQARAIRLLNAGLVGGHLALMSCAALFWVLRGPYAALWAVLSGLVAVVFFTIGQGIQVLVADAEPKTIFAASMTSYVLRAGALGALLAGAQAWNGRLAGLDPVAIAITAIAVVVGWLGAEIYAFTRLRIPSFDPPADPH